MISIKILSSTTVFNCFNTDNNKKCFSILEWFLKDHVKDNDWSNYAKNSAFHNRNKFKN